MLIELLSLDSRIIFEKEEKSWENAIRRGAQPLVEETVVEGRYIEKMIQNVKDIGPYIVIAPKMALAHARPEDGVNCLGMSLLLSEPPIHFSEKDVHDVHVLFTLAAPDSNSHLSLLAELATIFSEPLNFEELLKQKTEERVIQFLENSKGGMV